MGSDRRARWTAWKIVAILEWIALLIALAMPITPGKTGRDVSLAEWFFDEPSYLQEVFFYFVLTNLILGVLALIALAIIAREKRRDKEEF